MKTKKKTQVKSSLLMMDGTESTTRDRTTGKDENQGADSKVLFSGKPLHRFVRKEPRSLGIVIVIFGCAEFLMGFHLASAELINSCKIYIPFWQGILFLVCGSLSIYSEIHPSKKMVTVSLAMYVVSLLGIAVSACYRIVCLFTYGFRYKDRSDPWDTYRTDQIEGIEGMLLTSSLCVSVMLIFLCVIARLALRSTRTQVIVQHIVAPQRDTTPN
ncbi:membrane-spanning 4-domains subfamily A member 4D-like [Cheilinus undulatus]|uniref:membrane-spanning 4-domains subfamily A member 4D-like n=1 Tax=Cheilinus undulatus TaxID=241271 RepID=UPI001BD59536|nr:membrane-spanning 4-domains subfamily A member 4D-like [Cheilinus undulatus]